MFNIDDDENVKSKNGFYVSYIDPSNGRRFYLTYGQYQHNWIDEKARAYIVPNSEIDCVVAEVIRCYAGCNFTVEPV